MRPVIRDLLSLIGGSGGSGGRGGGGGGGGGGGLRRAHIYVELKKTRKPTLALALTVPVALTLTPAHLNIELKRQKGARRYHVCCEPSHQRRRLSTLFQGALM